MVSFPNCKINLGLNILRKRPDGYHDLESVFYPISLSDILEITENQHKTELINTGLEIECPMDKNLCYKAYELLKKKFDLPHVRIHLHKIIPFGAGLGGGSSDAAYTIKLLNELFALNLSVAKMQKYAAMTGSDCAFFINNIPAIATGRGEILKKTDLNLSHYKILLIKPNIHISTAEAYSGIKPSMPEISIEEVIKKPLADWKFLLKNDFETHLFTKYSELAAIKETLYSSEAIYAAMSGSGSTVFGIYPKDFNTTKVKSILEKHEIFERDL